MSLTVWAGSLWAGISIGWLLALLNEAESFFISHIRQGLRILLFFFANSKCTRSQIDAHPYSCTSGPGSSQCAAVCAVCVAGAAGSASQQDRGRRATATSRGRRDCDAGCGRQGQGRRTAAGRAAALGRDPEQMYLPLLVEALLLRRSLAAGTVAVVQCRCESNEPSFNRMCPRETGRRALMLQCCTRSLDQRFRNSRIKTKFSIGQLFSRS
jgi:hypothetical protein